MNNNRVGFIPMLLFAGVDITANFKLVGTIDAIFRYINFNNLTDVPVIISYNGTYGAEIINTGDTEDFYPQLCSAPTNKRSVFKNKTKIYVKAASVLPKGGGLIVSGYY